MAPFSLKSGNLPSLPNVRSIDKSSIRNGINKIKQAVKTTTELPSFPSSFSFPPFSHHPNPSILPSDTSRRIPPDGAYPLFPPDGPPSRFLPGRPPQFPPYGPPSFYPPSSGPSYVWPLHPSILPPTTRRSKPQNKGTNLPIILGSIGFVCILSVIVIFLLIKSKRKKNTNSRANVSSNHASGVYESVGPALPSRPDFMKQEEEKEKNVKTNTYHADPTRKPINNASINPTFIPEPGVYEEPIGGISATKQQNNLKNAPEKNDSNPINSTKDSYHPALPSRQTSDIYVEPNPYPASIVQKSSEALTTKENTTSLLETGETYEKYETYIRPISVLERDDGKPNRQSASSVQKSSETLTTKESSTNLPKSDEAYENYETYKRPVSVLETDDNNYISFNNLLDEA